MDMFRDRPEAGLPRMLQTGVAVRVKPGHTCGDAVLWDGLILVISGGLHPVDAGPHGRRLIVRHLGPEDIADPVAELWIEYGTMLEAQRESRLWLLPRGEVARLLGASAWCVLGVLGHTRGQHHRRLREASLFEVTARVAHELAWLVRDSGGGEGAAVTERQLGEALGISRSEVGRAIVQLGHEGLLSRQSRGHMLTPDLEALEALEFPKQRCPRPATSRYAFART